jgi:uncharacterized membrane protein
MLTTNRDLMQQAREALKGHWGLAIGGSLVYLLLAIGISLIPLVGWIGGIIIEGPLILGWTIFFLALSRKQESKLAQLFDGFQRFTKALGTYLLMILCIFPFVAAVIAALSYSQTFFILAENPEMKSSDALRKSEVLMVGNRWKLFCLFWRFFGWALLCFLSLGIGFLWLFPYMQTSLARFYDDLKGGEVPPAMEDVASQPVQPETINI